MEENAYSMPTEELGNEDTQPIDFFGGKLPSENEMAAMNLQVLMSKLDGDDKCVVCQAIQTLRKKDTQSNSSWNYLLPLMIFGFLGTDAIDSKLFDAFVTAYTNVKSAEQKSDTSD